MGLHLKNFMKIKTPRPKNSILFYSTPKGILSFYDLPLNNSIVLQLGDGGGGGGRTAISRKPLRKTAPSHSNKATQTEMDLALTVV